MSIYGSLYNALLIPNRVLRCSPKISPRFVIRGIIRHIEKWIVGLPTKCLRLRNIVASKWKHSNEYNPVAVTGITSGLNDKFRACARKPDCCKYSNRHTQRASRKQLDAQVAM